jgi:ribose transport system permease protein
VSSTRSDGPAAADGAELPPAERLRRLLERSPAVDAFLRGVTLVGFVLMVLTFSLLSPDIFPTWENVKSILSLAAPTIILAVGLTVVLVAGEFDLSFSGLVALCAVGAVKAMADSDQGATVAVLVALAIGLGGGLVAGLLVATQRASSFIITLALGSVWGGLALGWSGAGGSTITDVTRGYTDIALAELATVPLPVLYAVVVAVMVYALLRWTVFGREAHAVGSNPSAARLTGVRLGTTKVGAFVVMGLCVGIAAVLLSSRTGSYSPGISAGLLIPPFVAAFFGTSVLAVGRFNVVGTVVGALFVATLGTGLVVEGLEAWVSDVLIGAVLVVILLIAAETRTVRR